MAAAKKYWEEETSLETGEPDPIEEYPAESRVVSGSVWMLAIALALFFLPVANGMIAGIAGGYRVGTPRNALMAALGPMTFATCFLWMILTLLPLPIFGEPLTQTEALALIVLTDFGMLIGAGIGGAIAQNKIDRLNRV